MDSYTLKNLFLKIARIKVVDKISQKYSICAHIRHALTIGVTCLLITGNLYSQSSGGGYGNSYLLRDNGARSISMGGAFTAVANDPYAVFYNPGGLSWLDETPAFATSYSFLEFNRVHASAAWGQSLSENFGLGFGVNSFSTGNFMSRDVFGTPLKEMTDFEIALTGAASYKLEFASIGMAVKYLRHSLTGSEYSADGFSFDLGSKFNIADLFTFGVAIQNFSGVMFWNSLNKETNILPFTVRTGIAFEFGLNEEEYTTRSTVSGELEEVYSPATRYVLFALDAVLTQYEQGPQIILGIEGVPHEVIAFRAGLNILGDKLGSWQLFPMTIWGVGVSLRPDFEDMPLKFNFDYTVGNDYLASNGIAHHISIYFELK